MSERVRAVIGAVLFLLIAWGGIAWTLVALAGVQ